MDPYEGVIKVFTAVWDRYEELGFTDLSEPEQIIFCTWQFVCDVNNGGFRQYLINPAGEFAAEGVAALEAVGMPRAAALLRRALAVVPNQKVPKPHETRSRAIGSLPAAINEGYFQQLTDEFFASPEDPYALQWDYITRHRLKFPKSVGL